MNTSHKILYAVCVHLYVVSKRLYADVAHLCAACVQKKAVRALSPLLRFIAARSWAIRARCTDAVSRVIALGVAGISYATGWRQAV